MSEFALLYTAPFFEVLDIEGTQNASSDHGRVVFLQCRVLPPTFKHPGIWVSGLAPGWTATGWRPAANVPSQDAFVIGPDGSAVAVQVEIGAVLPGAIR